MWPTTRQSNVVRCDHKRCRRCTELRLFQGHRGPLCGSCEVDYAKSRIFSCQRCFTGFGSVMAVLFSVAILIALSSVTVRSNLLSILRRATMRRIEGSGASRRRVPASMRLEMTEIMHPQDTPPSEITAAPLETNPLDQTPHPSQAERDVEIAKWKAVELFKVFSLSHTLPIDMLL